MILSQHDPLVTPDELHSLLLTEEIALESRTKNIIPVEHNPQAFFSHRHSSYNSRGSTKLPYRGKGKPPRFSSYSTGTNYNSGPSPNSSSGVNISYYQQPPSYNSSSDRSSFGQQHFSYNSDRPICQICQKMGHLVIDCYNRLNFSYIGRTPPAKLQAFMANKESVASNSQPSLHQPSWILDTGATNHVTNDFSNLSLSTEYNGTDRLSIGNGDELPIHNTSTSLLHTPTHHFFFNDVLYVTSIKQNLLSVSRLLHDNNCSIIFTHNKFFVKDNNTGNVLLNDSLRDGLYRVNTKSYSSSSTPFIACIGIKASTNVWHSRLGHPS